MVVNGSYEGRPDFTGQRSDCTRNLLKPSMNTNAGRDAGTISVREATDQFEAERQRVIRERQEYNRRQEAGGGGLG
jgi:hypothetical protein